MNAYIYILVMLASEFSPVVSTAQNCQLVVYDLLQYELTFDHTVEKFELPYSSNPFFLYA